MFHKVDDITGQGFLSFSCFQLQLEVPAIDLAYSNGRCV